MHYTNRSILLIIVAALVFGQLAESSLYKNHQYGSRILIKRQATEDNSDPNTNNPGESDNEPDDDNKQSNNQRPTSQAPPNQVPMNTQTNNGPNNQMPYRPHHSLYPVFPPQGPFMPPFSPSGPPHRLEHPSIYWPPPPHGANNGPPGLIPFGVDQQTNNQQTVRSPMSINDLGRKLMSMFGIGKSDNVTSSNGESSSNDGPSTREQEGVNQEQLQALRNATVLQQLNRGMHSVFSNLSKMWNSTVQQQLDLLEDKMRQETSNRSNPFQLRVAQQVPKFFQTMSARVNDAQDNLDKFWRQVSNNGTLANITQLESRLADHRQQQLPTPARNGDFIPPNIEAFSSLDQQPPSFDFINRIQRTFGFGGGPPGAEQDSFSNQQANGGGNEGGFKASVMNFWHNQVQPQMARLQSKISRVWQDLTNNGVVQSRQQEPSFGGFIPVGISEGSNNRQDNGLASPASIDNLLNSIDLNNSEYSLLEPETKNSNQQNDLNTVGTRIQNGVINMQRDLNRMWHSLTNSLQSALGNVQTILNPPPPFGLASAGSQNQEQFVTRHQVTKVGGQSPTDQSVNEIDGKIKELSRLQHDADNVYNVIQDQQQQRISFANRFKNFFNNINVADYVSPGFQDSISNFGHSVNDFWHRIPERWDSFVYKNGNKYNQAKSNKEQPFTSTAGPNLAKDETSAPKPTTSDGSLGSSSSTGNQDMTTSPSDT